MRSCCVVSRVVCFFFIPAFRFLLYPRRANAGSTLTLLQVPTLRGPSYFAFVPCSHVCARIRDAWLCSGHQLYWMCVPGFALPPTTAVRHTCNVVRVFSFSFSFSFFCPGCFGWQAFTTGACIGSSDVGVPGHVECQAVGLHAWSGFGHNRSPFGGLPHGSRLFCSGSPLSREGLRSWSLGGLERGPGEPWWPRGSALRYLGSGKGWPSAAPWPPRGAVATVSLIVPAPSYCRRTNRLESDKVFCGVDRRSSIWSDKVKDVAVLVPPPCWACGLGNPCGVPRLVRVPAGGDSWGSLGRASMGPLASSTLPSQGRRSALLREGSLLLSNLVAPSHLSVGQTLCEVRFRLLALMRCSPPLRFVGVLLRGEFPSACALPLDAPYVAALLCGFSACSLEVSFRLHALFVGQTV